MGTLLEQDKYRYAVEKMPRFQRLFRCCQEAGSSLCSWCIDCYFAGAVRGISSS